MTVFSRAFIPTANRRLNELIGFLVLVFATLLVLALVSYSPLDPSLNTAATPPAAGEAIVKQIKGAKLVALDAAHISNIEQPQLYTETVVNFLRG